MGTGEVGTQNTFPVGTVLGVVVEVGEVGVEVGVAVGADVSVGAPVARASAGAASAVLRSSSSTQPVRAPQPKATAKGDKAMPTTMLRALTRVALARIPRDAQQGAASHRRGTEVTPYSPSETYALSFATAMCDA